MNITVNELSATLHLRDGTDLTLADSSGEYIASQAFSSIQKRKGLVNVGDDRYISPRYVVSMQKTLTRKPKIVPNPCPLPCGQMGDPAVLTPSGELTVDVGQEFDPLEGVTAYDDNGYELNVTVELI